MDIYSVVEDAVLVLLVDSTKPDSSVLDKDGWLSCSCRNLGLDEGNYTRGSAVRFQPDPARSAYGEISAGEKCTDRVGMLGWQGMVERVYGLGGGEDEGLLIGFELLADGACCLLEGEDGVGELVGEVWHGGFHGGGLMGLYDTLGADSFFLISLPPRPQPPAPPHAYPAGTPKLALVDGPLGHAALALDPLNNPIKLCLDHYPPDNHLAQGGVQRLEVEDEVELAHVLEQAVQSLDEDLDQVEQGQRRLGGGGDDDEVEGGVVALGAGAGGRGARQEVAGRVGAVGDEGEDLGDQALLHARVELRVELGQARLAGVVEDEDGVDHGGWCACLCLAGRVCHVGRTRV
ncbi:hypothetical protein OPT61_g4912 [Boeremia exigua]|uniref:Uncharacterized protein n=1 Tax=Boeremia exigua TaxID=749465 RepID=A0ACC2ICH0_9PLEO|nr:hypothetical protein OPT61_g4912 [Boeremia exigua]